MTTNRVDLGAKGTNMFGILPCPKCQSTYRWPKQDGTLVCDDCGFTEQGDFSPGERTAGGTP